MTRERWRLKEKKDSELGCIDPLPLSLEVAIPSASCFKIRFRNLPFVDAKACQQQSHYNSFPDWRERLELSKTEAESKMRFLVPSTRNEGDGVMQILAKFSFC